MLTARGAEQLARAVDEVRRVASGPDAVASVAADLSTADGVACAVEETVTRFGGLDILVNNMGLARGAGLVDTSDAEWQEAFDQTLFPAIRASRLAVPLMRARGGGAIVMITSIWGRESGGRMTYNAVKAAETSLAKSLAQQLAPHNIRVVGVAPGSILFPGGSWHKRQQADPEGIAEFVKTRPAVRPVRACRGSRRGRGVSRLAAGQLGQRRVGRRGRLPVQVEPVAGYTPQSRIPPIRTSMLPASVSDAIQAAADALYVPWLVVLLFGSGLFLTLRLASCRCGASARRCGRLSRRRTRLPAGRCRRSRRS